MNYLGIVTNLYGLLYRKTAKHRLGALMAAVIAVVFSLFASTSLPAQASSSGSGAVRTTPGFVANSIPRNDDGSTSRAIPIGFNINFFGQVFSDAWVNNNGNI